MPIKRPKYAFRVGQVFDIQAVRHSFSKSWPSSEEPTDRRPEPQYLFQRQRDDSPLPISEPELDRLIFNREFRALSDGETKSRAVGIGPNGPRDKWAPVRKFWCERYDEGPVPHSKASLNRFIQKILDEWKDRPELPTITPACWTLRGWVKTRGVPGSRPMTVMERRPPNSRKISSKLRKRIMEWAVAWFWSARPRDRMDAQAKIVRMISFLNRRALKANPDAAPIEIPDYSTTCRHILKAERKQTWAAKNNEKAAYRRYNGVHQGLTATRLLEKVVIDGTRGDQHLALAIDDETLEPVGRPTVQFAICVRTRVLLAVTVTFEDPSLYTAMAVLKRMVLPKVDLIAARPDLRETLEPHGKPGAVVLDNAWEEVGKTAQDALEDAHIDVIWADKDDPEFKAIGERAIGTFSRKLFHKAPGGIPYPPYILRKMNLDPLKTAVMTSSDLEERVLDAIDDYHRQKHDGLGGLAAIEMWQRESQIHGIETLSDPEFLDSAFAEVFDVSITREGVLLERTRYHDELNTTLLLERLAPLEPGHHRRTTIRARAKAKRPTADLTVLYVWNHRDQEYVRLPAKDAHHLLGMNRQQRILYKTFAESAGLPFNTDEDKARARLRVIEELERKLPGELLRTKRKQRQLLAPPPQHIIGTSLRVQTLTPSPTGMNDLQVPVTYGSRAGDGMPSRGPRRGGKRATAKSQRTRNERSSARKTAEEALARAQQSGGPAHGFVPSSEPISQRNCPDRPEGATQKAFTLKDDASDFLRRLQEQGWGAGSSAAKRQNKGE